MLAVGRGSPANAADIESETTMMEYNKNLIGGQRRYGPLSLSNGDARQTRDGSKFYNSLQANELGLSIVPRIACGSAALNQLDSPRGV
jgi:hypothetical protein